MNSFERNLQGKKCTLQTAGDGDLMLACGKDGNAVMETMTGESDCEIEKTFYLYVQDESHVLYPPTSNHLRRDLVWTRYSFSEKANLLGYLSCLLSAGYYGDLRFYDSDKKEWSFDDAYPIRGDDIGGVLERLFTDEEIKDYEDSL